MVLNAQDLAIQRQDETALHSPRRQLSWAEVDDAANRIANGLHARVRGPERRVAVFAHNAPEVLLLHLAAINSGVSVVSISYHLTEAEASYILRDSESEIVFVDSETAAVGRAAARAAGVRYVIGWGSELDPPVESFGDWLAGNSAAPPPLDVQSRPNVLYTSGTTGLPKRVETPPVLFEGGTIEPYVESLRRFRYFMDDGLHLVSGPLYHTGPLIAARLLAVGKPIAMLERFDPEEFLRLVSEHRVETTLMVPTHFIKLLELPESVRAKYDVSSLRLVVHLGSACPIDVKRQMIEWFGPVFFESYGATESGTVTRIDSTEWLERPGSVGRVTPPFTRALAVDDDGNELGPGEVGRLYFEDPSGRGIVYGGDEEKTREAHLRPGVFTLGDIGYVDEAGYVFVTDRFGDMIISGGVNIYPAEAEQVLADHPAVADIAVIGVPDAVMGEAAKALVVLTDPAHPVAPDALIDFCRQRLAGFKCPRTIEFVDSLNRNPIGKVNKRLLRAPYWQTERTIG